MAKNDLKSSINDLKGRIGEALVESIFRRAGYRVARVGRESQVQGLVKVGAAEFCPDFLVWQQVSAEGPERHLHKLFPIEVKYRANLQEFMRKEIEPLVARVRDQWPQLYCIVVTDSPENGRSCFQVLTVRDHTPGSVPALSDLHDVKDLDIYSNTVHEYEGLVQAIFSLLNRYGTDN